MKTDKEKYERKALRDEARKSKITQELGGYGLLTTEAAIDCVLSTLRHSEAFNLIKAQLRYRKKYHRQSADSKLFRFSVGGVNHDLGQLVSNLKELVGCVSISDATDKDNFRESFIGCTCYLSAIQISDDTVLSGPFTISQVDQDETVHLNGSSRVSFARQEFEDFIDDGVITLL